MFKSIWGKASILILLFMVAFSTHAKAQAVDQAGNRTTATLGDQDSNKNYRVSTDTTGLFQFANDTSIAYPYENLTVPTTAYSLSSSDSGLYIVDWGGTSVTNGLGNAKAAVNPTLVGRGSTYLLPACVTATEGFKYEVYTAVSEQITITPSTTADSIEATIGAGSALVSGEYPAAGQGLKNSSEHSGDGMGVMCISPGQWILTKASGTITLAP
jgi:hypothetical protein